MGQFLKPISAAKEWQENKAVMVAYRRYEFDGPERVGTRSLDVYTRSMAAFISCIARDPILPVPNVEKMRWRPLILKNGNTKGLKSEIFYLK